MNYCLLLDGEELAKSKHLTARASFNEARAVRCLELKAAAETGIYASRAAHTLAPSASARDAASSPARRKRTIRTASRDIPH